MSYKRWSRSRFDHEGLFMSKIITIINNASCIEKQYHVSCIHMLEIKLNRRVNDTKSRFILVEFLGAFSYSFDF